MGPYYTGWLFLICTYNILAVIFCYLKSPTAVYSQCWPIKTSHTYMFCTQNMYLDLWLAAELSVESNSCSPLCGDQSHQAINISAVHRICIQASGWLLSCLQSPTAVHLYVVPSHTKPGIADRFLHDLEVRRCWRAQVLLISLGHKNQWLLKFKHFQAFFLSKQDRVKMIIIKIVKCSLGVEILKIVKLLKRPCHYAIFFLGFLLHETTSPVLMKDSRKI